MGACREPLRIGHGDRESQNIRWTGDRVLAVHDWDSVIAQREVAIAGLAAAVWPAAGEPGQAATVEQSADFLTCCQAAAGARWTGPQVQHAWAAGLGVRLFNAKKDAAAGGRAVAPMGLPGWVRLGPRPASSRGPPRDSRQVVRPGGRGPDNRQADREGYGDMCAWRAWASIALAPLSLRASSCWRTAAGLRYSSSPASAVAHPRTASRSFGRVAAVMMRHPAGTAPARCGLFERWPMTGPQRRAGHIPP